MTAHGTLSAYTRSRCRCPRCIRTHRRYGTHRRRQLAYGRWEPYTDAQPVRDHLRRLSEHGMSYRQAARQAGVAPSAAAKILYGEPGSGRPPTRRVRAETAAALLAVRPDLGAMAATSLVDSTGTRRRLQALVACGWPQKRLGERLGMDRKAVNLLIGGNQRVYAATALRVRALFDDLWDTAPPETTPAERTAASRARNRAAERGWPPPLAWDDDTIDDPAAEPDTGGQTTRQDALAEDAAWLMGLGHPRGAVAARLGVSEEYVKQVLRRASRAA